MKLPTRFPRIGILVLLGAAALLVSGADRKNPDMHSVIEGGRAAPPGVIRSDEAVRARIERKQKRERGELPAKPQHPGDLARERYRDRAGEDGVVPMDGLLKAKEHIEAMRAAGPRDAGVWSWEWLGPGNVGGRVRTILVHPTIPGRMWIGSVAGGIWRTDDSGASWTPVDDFMANLAVTSMVIDPVNPNVLYAATGEGFFNFDALPGAGIFRSLDGGVTWSQLPSTNNPNFQWVNRLAHHPTISNRLFAATKDPSGIWRSTNGGGSWTQVLSLVDTDTTAATDIKIHPTNPNLMLVGTQDLNLPSFRSEVFYSSDGGTIWFEQTVGGAKLPDTSFRCEVAFAGNSSNMYASMDRNGGEVWRSTDNAATWTLLNAGSNYLGTQGWYDNMIWVDPTNSSLIIVGGIDLWRSTNGGTTFFQISDWRNYHTGTSAHADQHFLAPVLGYNGTSVRRVYIGNDGGIQTAADIATVTTNSGWSNLANGLGITQFYGAAAAPNGSVLVGGTQDNDKLRYTGNANGWFQAETGDGGYSAIDFNNTSIFYGSQPRLQIKKSTNGGQSYVNAFSGITDAGFSQTTRFIAPFVMDPNNSSRLIAGGANIWRTTNSAGSWTSIRPPLGGTPTPRCSAIGIKPGNSSEIWVGYDTGVVSRTTNGGTSWTNIDGNPPGLPNRVVTDIAVSPFFAGEAVVTFSGYNTNNLWMTFDGGATWQQRTGAPPHDLPALPVNTVTYHPVNIDLIYIGTDLGVFTSNDFGATWSTTPAYENNDGPANVSVADLFFYGGDQLVAATHGRGIYRSVIDVVFVDGTWNGPEDGTQSNPFNTVVEGLNACVDGTTLSIRAGTYIEAPITFPIRGHVQATGGSVVIR